MNDLKSRGEEAKPTGEWVSQRFHYSFIDEHL